MTFNPEITLGQVATALSVVVAALTLLIATWKDRKLRQREYADTIRTAAAETAAILDRWKHLELRMYEDMQPVITDSDATLVGTQNFIDTRDKLWRELVACRTTSSQRVTDEKIETAYVKLYSYDASFRQLFADVTAGLRKLADDYFYALLTEMQNDVLKLEYAERPYYSAQLGNELRATALESMTRLGQDFDKRTENIRSRLLAIIGSTDRQLTAGRRV